MSLPIPSTSGAPIDPKQLQAMDAPLIALTNSCGGDLRRLYFAFFSFLHRRTDFYLVPHEDDVKAGKYMGFPEGDAEKFLLAAFRQFPLRKIPKGGPQRPGAGQQKPKSPPAAPKAAAPTTSKTVDKAPTKKETPKETPKSAPPAAAASEAKPKEEASSTVDEKTPAAASDSSSSNDDKNTTPTAKNMEGVRYNEEGLQIPIGNGGSTPKYKWTQMIDECSVLIGVPPELSSAKDLNIKITPNSLSVKTKKPLSGQEEPLTIVEGKLSHKIRADESTWSMEGGVVIVTLDKLEKTFWKNILVGDEEIDTEEVDNRRYISEYDDATQGKIRQIIFDQNQYHLGGKTSDEILGEKGGNKPKIPTIPAMPPGVEYIDQKKLDQVEGQKATAKNANGGAKQATTTTKADGTKQKYTIDLDKK